MTKEQIFTHKELILWFIANPDKGIWYRHKDNITWVLTKEPSFNTKHVYAQNDELAEFRKARLDGKSLQYKILFDPKFSKQVWEDFDNTGEFKPSYNGNKIIYRLVQDLAFEVGNWVRLRNNVIGYIKVLNDSIEQDNCVNVQTGDAYTDWYSFNDLALWIPTDGEPCVYYNDNTESEYLVAKYNSKHIYDSFNLDEFKFTYDANHWDNIKPLKALNGLINA